MNISLLNSCYVPAIPLPYVPLYGPQEQARHIVESRISNIMSRINSVTQKAALKADVHSRRLADTSNDASESVRLPTRNCCTWNTVNSCRGHMVERRHFCIGGFDLQSETCLALSLISLLRCRHFRPSFLHWKRALQSTLELIVDLAYV